MEIEIIKKSNLANAKSPIQDWQFGKTAIAYTMPILYNRVISALIRDHNFAPKFLPLNISSNFAHLVEY